MFRLIGEPSREECDRSRKLFALRRFSNEGDGFQSNGGSVRKPQRWRGLLEGPQAFLYLRPCLTLLRQRIGCYSLLKLPVFPRLLSLLVTSFALSAPRGLSRKVDKEKRDEYRQTANYGDLPTSRTSRPKPRGPNVASEVAKHFECREPFGGNGYEFGPEDPDVFAFHRAQSLFLNGRVRQRLSSESHIAIGRPRLAEPR
jgi:hypothetical protein